MRGPARGRAVAAAAAAASFLLCVPGSSGAASTTLTGVASGTGYLRGCKVEFWKPGGLSGTGTTDGDGAFNLTIQSASASSLGPADLTGGALKLFGNSSDCIDQGTGLAPVISFGAIVPAYPAGTTAPTAAINGFTTLSFYVRKQVNSPQIKPYNSLFGGPDFEASQFYAFFGSALGLADAAKGATEDLVKGALAGNANDMRGQALSVALLNSLTLGSGLLAGLKPGTSADKAAEAMVVACFPAGVAVIKQGETFDLYKESNLVAIFNKALGGAPQDMVKAGAQTLSEMNTHMKAVGDQGPSPGGLAELARVQALGQRVILPLIPQVTSGALSVADFSAKYSGPALANQYSSQQVSSFDAAPAPAPSP